MKTRKQQKAGGLYARLFGRQTKGVRLSEKCKKKWWKSLDTSEECKKERDEAGIYALPEECKTRWWKSSQRPKRCSLFDTLHVLLAELNELATSSTVSKEQLNQFQQELNRVETGDDPRLKGLKEIIEAKTATMLESINVFSGINGRLDELETSSESTRNKIESLTKISNEVRLLKTSLAQMKKQILEKIDRITLINIEALAVPTERPPVSEPSFERVSEPSLTQPLTQPLARESEAIRIVKTASVYTTAEMELLKLNFVQIQMKTFTLKCPTLFENLEWDLQNIFEPVLPPLPPTPKFKQTFAVSFNQLLSMLYKVLCADNSTYYDYDIELFKTLQQFMVKQNKYQKMKGWIEHYFQDPNETPLFRYLLGRAAFIEGTIRETFPEIATLDAVASLIKANSSATHSNVHFFNQGACVTLITKVIESTLNRNAGFTSSRTEWLSPRKVGITAIKQVIAQFST